MNWDSSDLFFLDYGSLECERWLKEVTGEDFIDKENLTFSLLQGQHLRKVVNLLRKNTFHFDDSDTTCNILNRTGIYCDDFIDNRDWVSQFIVIAEKSLGIFPQYIFHWKDLHESCEAGFIGQKESIFRICVTIIKLFDLYRKRFPDLPKSKLLDFEIKQELLALHKRQINCFEAHFRRIRTHLMLTRYLEDVKKAAKFATEKSLTVNSVDDSANKPVITTRDVRHYPEITVPQPFVQPTNQFSIRMATQAVEQTIISKKQNEKLKKIKETIKPQNDDCHDHVNNWRNKRRARSISKIEANKTFENSFLQVYPVFGSQKRKDTQEQIIIASPNQRNEGSQDSGLENSTPEVSPPGAQTRAYWRADSASPVSSADDSLANSRAKSENMIQQRFVSSKRSLAPSPPTEETVQSLSSLSLHSTPQFEQNTNANFLCRKDHSEAALCKAVVAQGALEEASGTFKTIPSHKNGKFSSVRIEIEATRENHAKVAAVKTIPAKETARASGHFKPMCEMIDENLQKRQRNSYSAESSISPASSSRSSDFGGDNGSLDRMSFASSNAGSGGDYKVVALDAKPQPGKLSEFVPEVERSKRDESYVVSSYGNMNNLPSTDTAVVRNWELSDEELPLSKSFTNNNEKSSNVDSPNEEIKHEPAYVPLAKTHELEFSDNIPKVVLPKIKKSGKKRSKSTDSQNSSKSGSTVGSYVSAASSQKSDSKNLTVHNHFHSDTDSVPSPVPVINISSEDEHTEVIKRVPEIGENRVAHDSSSSVDEVLKTKYSPVEEETLHYAESNIQLDNIEKEEEQQYANINQDTLRSRSSRADSDYMETQSRKTGTEWATPREDIDFSEYRTSSQEPLFYDNAAKYGFDTSGGYHVPKQVYRREVPIFIEEPRYHSQNKTHVGLRWSPQPVQKYSEEDETQISRVTYRFYDRNMRELSSNTLIDRSRRESKSFEGGIEHYIEQLDTPYYSQTNSADRRFIRSQGYPTPFDVKSKNYVNADSKFRILPKNENRSRPIVTKVQQNEPTFYGETLQIHNNGRNPNGAPQQRRKDPFLEEHKSIEKIEKPQTMLTISGKLRCGHCALELGRGSAMIIEALGLFYHINCFRCHVCDRALGSGSQTTDVRVRDGKLHCEKCYSNEEIGVQLSEI